MKNLINVSLVSQSTNIVAIFLLFVLFGCTNNTPKMTEATNDIKSDNPNNNPTEVIWHIKAVHPEGSFLDIKALDKDGKIYDVKAIQDFDQRSILDIKAFIGGKRLPIKILVSNDKYSPVKAIGDDGTIYDIKALTSNGDKLDVKGVNRSGNIIHIKAINKEGVFYGVKAISPEGKLNDVKGIKVTKENIETKLNGVEVHAHIKAIPPMGCTGDNFIWHIKAVHPEGKLLDVMAIDKDGNTYDIKAIRESNQRSLMDIKAFVGKAQLPVKILVSNDKFAPVKAIGEDGTIYDIKALTQAGDKLDVKGVGRSGNIIHIKAINEKGEFYGIKAISPEGQLNDVKGVKMLKEKLELKVNGVDVYAHVKALSQAN